MPALAPYIPPRDTDMDAWLANFSTLITASPGTYGLVAADATAIAAAVLAWHTAYLLVTSGSTKTAATVSAKDTQKVNVLAIVRPYAQNISLNAGVSSGNKIALGVNPRTSVPLPITVPTTNPLITIQAALPLQHILRYKDSTASPSVKSKPYGVLQMQLFGEASATPITDPTLLPLLQVSTKSPLLVQLQSGDVGKQVYYAARWVTRTGLVGPFSPIVHFTAAG